MRKQFIKFTGKNLYLSFFSMNFFEEFLAIIFALGKKG